MREENKRKATPPEDRVEMKERDEPQKRDQHEARSAMSVFYHEFARFASRTAASGVDRFG
jgi:hypothetical protein